MNIVLCGMMGCGKTTVSAAISALTGMERVDIDEEIVKKYGRIADIFRNYGEARFREIESETVAKVASRDNLIIATGGGCVLSEQNVRLLKQNGKMVFLRARPETLLTRVAGDTERPLLAGGAGEQIEKLLLARTPKYLAAADIVTDTDDVAPDELARIIARQAGLDAEA